MTGRDSSNAIAGGTVAGMVEFLDYLVAKGYATASAVNPLKTAARIVFSRMEGDDDYGSFDVRTFDADEYMNRFENRVVGQYKQESLVAYRQRVKKAIAAYRGYLDDGNVSIIGSTGRAPRKPKAVPDPAKANGGNGNGHSNGNGEPDTAGSLIDYKFPLRSGQIANLRLPMRLEKTDAERLGAFLRTLVIEPQLELPPPQAEAA